jgi:hypothetical protein
VAAAAPATHVWRRHVGPGRRQGPQAGGPRRAGTGAIAASWWSAAAAAARARGAPKATRRRGAKTAPAPGPASNTGPAGWSWARGAMAVAQAARACQGPRRGATRAGPRRAGGGGRRPRGAGQSAREGRAAGREDVGRADGGGPDKALQRGAPRAGRRFERRPEAQEVAHERRRLLLPPRPDVGHGVVQGPGHAVGAPDWGAAQALARGDAGRPGAPGGAVGAEGGERVAVGAAACDLAGGVGGGGGRPARGKRGAGRGPGERRAGHEPADIGVAQGGHEGPFLECQAPGHGWSMQARAEGLAPGVPRGRARCKAQQLPWYGARGGAADRVWRLSPSEANKRGKRVGGLWRHG